MPVAIRPYTPDDYDGVIALYRDGSLFGGQFDENRDSRERLAAATGRFPEAVLVADVDGRIAGTVSLVDDGRVAWLFRFAVARTGDEAKVAEELHSKALGVLAERGHNEALVYTPHDDRRLAERYEALGMRLGGDYTCYWSPTTDAPKEAW